jgi:prolyl oligopeptidase
MNRRLALAALSLLSLHCGAAPAPTGGPPAPSATAPAASASAPAPVADKSGPPVAPLRPVVNEYQGVKVTDDYQWMEKADDPEVSAWSDAENTFTRRYLDGIAERAAVRERVSALLASASPDRWDLRYAGGSLFALKSQPPKQQPFLVALASADDAASERVLVDPNTLDPSGKTTIDFYVPSIDGKLVAVSLSQGGSESGTLHVFDVATGKERGDAIPRVHGGTAGGSVAFTGDGTGFYYTRYPHAGERAAADLDFYQQVYFHKLGTKESEDRFAIGKDFPRIAEVVLSTSDDGKRVLATVGNGDGGEYAHYLLGPKGDWAKITSFADKITVARFGADGGLYLLSLAGSPKGKIVKLAPGITDLAKAQPVVPESDVVIQGFTAGPSKLYVLMLAGGPSELRVYDGAGKALGPVPILPVSSVRALVRLRGDDLLFRNVSFTEPPAYFHYAAAEGKVHKTALAQTSPADFSDTEVVRETCSSKDGTKVPVSILRKKGLKLDGSSPALLTGYGGYGLSRQPRFNPTDRIWLDQGGVYAVANLRGGGEFGEEWHRAGNLLKKQNVFDDFAACAQHLVEAGYTKPERLGILGGSNGGLLMGAAMIQHPELYRAVVSLVGIYDMLRVELTPNGAFNVTEFGTVKDPDQFKALYAYSPYHHVTPGAAYPSVLFMTGKNDPRVDPYNSRKMTARLQASGTKRPVLLRTSADTGHGMGTPFSAEIDEAADIYAFLFHELGVPWRAPAKP